MSLEDELNELGNLTAQYVRLLGESGGYQREEHHANLSVVSDPETGEPIIKLDLVSRALNRQGKTSGQIYGKVNTIFNELAAIGAPADELQEIRERIREEWLKGLDYDFSDMLIPAAKYELQALQEAVQKYSLVLN